MDTDLDRDDALGQRLRALRSWHPVTGSTAAWQRVEHRRRRAHARRVMNGVVAVTVAAVTLALVINQSLGTQRHVSVVAPSPRPAPSPLAVLLPVAPVGAVDVTPAGPYHAGQRVHVLIAPTATFRPDDPLNQGVSVCYPWDGGETCDPTIQSLYVPLKGKSADQYDLTVPGWVYTPTGLQACDALHCRFEIENADGTRVGSAPVDIVSGVMPHVPARLSRAHRDEALVSILLDGIEPDPSWTRWSTNADPAAVARFPAGGISVCAFAARLLCDGLVRPDPPPFDGRPHDLVVSTNRLLLTARGWVDCVKVVCAIAISRAVVVEGNGQEVGSSAETIALVPYRLPPTTPEMQRPVLAIEPGGPLHIGYMVTATLHDPPPNVDPASRLLLAQCSAADLRTLNDCVLEFSDLSTQTQAWTTLADGSLQQRWRVTTCSHPDGCYLAIDPPVKGYPAVARSASFTVTP